MGTKMAPAYATLTLGFLELKLYAEIRRNYAPIIVSNFEKFYVRYLDDILVFFDSSHMSLNYISQILNNLSPDMNFILETSGNEVNFLDIKIVNNNSRILTDIFYKKTDTKQYLNFFSSHPRHVKRALPYNLARRIVTIVSEAATREERLEELRKNLVACKYPHGLIEDGIKKALSYNRDELLKPKLCKPNNTSKSIVHISTYSPNFPSNVNLIKEIFNNLQRNDMTREIFNTKNILFSKRQPQNLKRSLTKACFVAGAETYEVSMCRRARCKTCTCIITGSFYYFKNAHYNFKIKHNMSCDSKNCIYVLECQGCGADYIGETNDLRLRTNLHRDHILKNTGLNVSKHVFNCTKHFINEIKFKIMPFYHLSSEDINFRRNLELNFIAKFNPILNAAR